MATGGSSPFHIPYRELIAAMAELSAAATGARRTQEERGPEHSAHSIAVRNVTKRYRTITRTVDAVKDVSFVVDRGEFVSLVGPSGCGKSTILKMTAGILASDGGTITVLGEKARPGRREVGLMFQTPIMFPWRNVLRNVVLPFELFGEVTEANRAKALELLSLVGLQDSADIYPWELSGGMRQRASLARLLVTDPEILLMDEPLAALDELTRERLEFEIAGIQEKLRKTALYVTHDIKEALILSDRIVVLQTNPGSVAGEVVVDLPRPRRPELIDSEDFAGKLKEVRDLLRL